MTHEIIIGVYDMSPSEIQAGTSGSYGVEKMRFVFGEEWDGLFKTVTFYPKMANPVAVILTEGDIEIPHEATAKSGMIRFAVEGSVSGKVIRSLPGRLMVSETVKGSGAPGQSPTPTETEQIKNFAKSASDALAKALDAIEEGKIKGEQGDKGDKGDKGDPGEQGESGERGFSGVYVGSGEMPEGYNVQIDPEGEGFAYSPVQKTSSMTQEVGVDTEGRLWTSPGSGGGSGGTISIDSAMSETSENAVQNKVIKAYVDGSIPKEAISKNTEARHSHENKDLLDTYLQTEENLSDAVSKKHIHENKALLDTYTQTEENLSDTVSKKHIHENKELIDSYTQTEENLSDAVAQKHSHENKDILDGITSEKISSWDGKKDILIVDSLPSSPAANTVYLVY